MKKINKEGRDKLFFVTNVFLLILFVSSVTGNQIILAKVSHKMGMKNMVMDKLSINFWSSTNKNGIKLSGDLLEDTIKLVISKGIPTAYGAELNVNFDQAQQSMDLMKQYDPTYGKNKIILQGDDLQRYIDVGLKISCEYCCSATSIINSSGAGACGCAHSQAMRGLMAYLIQYHGGEYTNDEILRELARWKGIYFPKQMIQKLSTQLQGSDFTPDTASLLIGLDLPDYGGGDVPLPSDINNLPNMVGGC
jgi:hypothetical protein